MTKTTWKIEAHTAKPHRHVFDLVCSDDVSAQLTIERLDEGFLVRVEFSHQAIVRARAHTSHLAAMVFDTMSDIETDIVAEDVTVWRTAVEVSGCDAIVTVAPYFAGDFGAGNACDALVDALAGSL